MSAAKHTPGPWTLEMPDDGCPWRIVADGEFVSHISESRYYTNKPDPEAEANARLIAAAPALLDALERLLDQSHVCGHDCDPNKTCPRGDAARAAIRAAKGEA